MKPSRIYAAFLVIAVALCVDGGLSRLRAQMVPADPVYSEAGCGAYAAGQADGGGTAQAYLVGDLNGNGHVNVVDLLILAESWAKSTGIPGFNPEADFNCDGTINSLDLTTLAGNWGL